MILVRRSICFAALVLALTQSADAQNLLTNGGFELGPPVPGSYLPVAQGSTAIDGWTVTRGQIDIVTTAIPPAEGLRSLDLNGSPGSGGVIQTIVTVPGAEYVVSFQFRGNFAGAPSTKHMRVEVDGGSQFADFSVSATSPWEFRAWTFAATSVTTDLELYSLDPINSFGPMIDDVVVRPTVGSSFCPAQPNSTGLAGRILASGSVTVSAADFALIADQLPAGEFGYFLASQSQGAFTPPGSQGIICLSGNIGRFNAVPLIIQGPGGGISVDLTSIPVNPPQAALPGDTWNFQCWHRDNNPGPTSNFTNAVSVTLQ